MIVTLTPELEAMVQRKLESGPYADAGEVVREALQLMEERDRLQRLRAAVLEGVEQVERGEGRLYTPELRAEIHQAARKMSREGRQPHDDVVP